MRIRKKHDGEQRRRFSPLMWIASLIAAFVLILGVTGTLAAFTASITNDQNHVQSAGPNSFGLAESNVVNSSPVSPPCATVTAGESAICSDINKYGTEGAAATPMSAGDTRTTTVNLLNTATANPAGLTGTLTLHVGPCTSQAFPPVSPPTVVNPGICSVVTVSIVCPGTPGLNIPAPGETLTALAAGGTPPGSGNYTVDDLAPEESVNCVFTTTMPGTLGNPLPAADQDQLTSQDLTWTLTNP